MERKSEEMRLERLQKKARTRFIVVIVMSVVMYVVMFYQSGWYFFWGEERHRIGADDPMWMNVICMIIGSFIVTGIFFGIFYRLIVHRAYEKFNQEFKNKYVLSVIGEMGLFENLGYQLRGGMTVTGIFFGIFYRLIVHRAYEKFNQEFKNKYVLSVIGEMGLFENLGYQLRGGMTYDEVRNAAVVSCGDRCYFSSEDMLTGCYHGFSFRYCDVVTKYLAGAGKNRRVEPIFEGQIIQFTDFDRSKESHGYVQMVETIFEGQIIQFTDFDRSKESHGYVQIFEKKFISSIKGWTEKHKILTENEVFNSRFEVFATDEHNAFYILTPKLLELIMRFEEDIDGQIAITFRGSSVFNSRFEVFATDEHNAFYILTPKLLELIMRFEEDIDGQIAITFRGSSMFVALNRLGSMFDGKLDRKIEDQKELIRKDVEMLRHAGDILILENAWRSR